MSAHNLDHNPPAPIENSHVAPVVKSCDLSGNVAAQLFALLNPHDVRLKHPDRNGVYTFEGSTKAYTRNLSFGNGVVIITDVEPDQLRYPEGWYYAKGSLRNKHTSTTGIYFEVPMLNSHGQLWEKYARYCTLA